MQLQKKVRRGKRKKKKQPNKLLTCDYNISYVTCDQINEKLGGETKKPYITSVQCDHNP
jgi:hypothetical protein